MSSCLNIVLNVDVESNFKSAPKITQQLRKLFPKVFAHLDKRTALSSQSGQEEKPIWRLLNKTGQNLTIVDIAFPTGTDLAKHKGREKASVTECHLWFVTRNHIPHLVYESWNTQPIIAGSDSDCEVNSDLEFSELESTGDDEDNNSKLASSLMVLDLSDSEEPQTRDICDAKVKGKSRSFETPSLNNGMSNAKRTHAVLSPDESPTNDRVVAKRLKSETAAISGPLFLSSQSSPSFGQLNLPVTASLKHKHPEYSRPPAVVSVSESDVLWRNQPHPDDLFAPAMINPWESQYSVIPIHFLI
ncbi:hypothetical protein K503DRAFT_860569 [Rhizopogon vinicolor AM-OR11-026]|uniref:Uncharacterized protein n=1 Tax=Rhizopogon vinicolor AM-OR11-026 TaxID=1314800 RepID=A0A1B7MH23_9AGAM|nr:hypothetical protein K503DRAFT_860569 [Rhizopogon vinicolor AM-OR11-026]